MSNGNDQTTKTTESSFSFAKVATGMVLLGKLYSNNSDEQATTIAYLLMGTYDEELAAAFSHVHGAEAGIKMVAELKETYRQTLQIAINNEADKLTSRRQQEACEKFMGNHEPHQLGTVNELAKRYNVSKAEIRRLKQSGKLEEFVNEQQN